MYVCLYAHACIWRERDVWISMHGLSCISTHINPRQSAAQTAVRMAPRIYLPQQPHGGRPVCAASSSGVGCNGGPVPVYAAAPAVGYSEYSPWGALRTHQGTVSTHTCGMRRTGAISVRCSIAWRVRACSAPPMSAHVGEALSFVRSQASECSRW